MSRVYRNTHIALISALLFTAVVFEASAIQRVLQGVNPHTQIFFAP